MAKLKLAGRRDVDQFGNKLSKAEIAKWARYLNRLDRGITTEDIMDRSKERVSLNSIRSTVTGKVEGTEEDRELATV